MEQQVEPSLGFSKTFLGTSFHFPSSVPGMEKGSTFFCRSPALSMFEAEAMREGAKGIEAMLGGDYSGD